MVMRVHSRENNSWALAPATVQTPARAPIGVRPAGVGMGGVLTVIGLGWSLWDWYHRSFGNPDDFKPKGPTLEEQVQILEQEAQRLARSPNEADQSMARVLRGFIESFELLMPGLSVDTRSIFERSTPTVAGGIHPVIVASAGSPSPAPAAGAEGGSFPDDWAESEGYLVSVSSPGLVDGVIRAAATEQKLAVVPSKELQSHLAGVVEVTARGKLSRDDLVRLKALATRVPELAPAVAMALDENKARLTEADMAFLHQVPDGYWARFELGPLHIAFVSARIAID